MPRTCSYKETSFIKQTFDPYHCANSISVIVFQATTHDDQFVFGPHHVNMRCMQHMFSIYQNIDIPFALANMCVFHFLFLLQMCVCASILFISFLSQTNSTKSMHKTQQNKHIHAHRLYLYHAYSLEVYKQITLNTHMLV